MSRMVSRMTLLGDWSDSAWRDCTMAIPASIIVANWRVNTTKSARETLPPLVLPFLETFPQWIPPAGCGSATPQRRPVRSRLPPCCEFHDRWPSRGLYKNKMAYVFDIKMFYRPTRNVISFALRLDFYSFSRGLTKASFIPKLRPKMAPWECPSSSNPCPRIG
jgi:hypothetical protein